MMPWTLHTLVLLSLLCITCDGTQPSRAKRKEDVTSEGSGKTKILTYEERQGKSIYRKYCEVCHGDEGKGDGFNSYNLEPRPRDFSDSTYMGRLSDAQLVETISQGGRGVNKSPLMPMWGATLSKDDILNLVYYLRTLSSTANEMK